MAARKKKAEPTAPTAAQVEQERMKLEERLGNVVHRLQGMVEERITKRMPLEDRWIANLEQYHGRYDRETSKALGDGKKSSLFINMTMQKTNAMSARLMDLLFPTDDRNWAIQPTPVPLLNEDAAAAVAALREIEEQLKAMQEQQATAQGAEGGGAPAETDPALRELEKKADFARRMMRELQSIIDEARARCEQMELEIDDQLRASGYHAAMRDMLEDACKIGTGVCKGPVTGDRVRRGWKKRKTTRDDGTEGPAEFVLDVAQDEAAVPAIRYVDVWNFFPDMDVRCIKDSEGEFERHLMNAKQLRQLAKLPGFDKDALRRLLSAKPKGVMPAYMAQLRDITAGTHSVPREAYQVFEYSGPLTAEDVWDIAMAKSDEATMRDLADMDPLDEVNAIVWFCDGEILKIAPYPFDSGETIYSVFNLLKDEASIFGYGIPHIMADPQRSLNAGWRAMMDNAGLGAGPQFVIDQTAVEPANGLWEIVPRKMWLAKKGIPKEFQAPFQAIKIDMHQEELANIIAISKQFIDDMTAMPSIAQGEQGATPQKTAFGTALLMNGANVTFRRIVKAFDDDVTVPNITRFYDWNMQFSSKEEIKGDYGVDARGSSVLLVRELQAQNLMVIALQLGGHPIYGPMLKQRDLLKKLFQAHMIAADEVLLTDDEIDGILAQADAATQAAEAEREARGQELEFRRLELDAKVQMANMEAASRREVAQLQHQTAMMTLAEKLNMNMANLEAMLEGKRRETESKERIFAAEAAVTERMGASGGGHF